jgi:dCTP deaminase
VSILGRGELIARLLSGKIVVSPILSVTQIGAASIDLRLGNIVLMVRARGSSHVDPQAAKKIATSTGTHDEELDRQQKHVRYEIPFHTRFLLHPGTVGIATATFIEPNYQGIVTLELANMGQIPIALYPGMRVAQIAFSEVIGETKRLDESQFRLSFEPKQGEIAGKDDFPFIP